MSDRDIFRIYLNSIQKNGTVKEFLYSNEVLNYAHKDSGFTEINPTTGNIYSGMESQHVNYNICCIQKHTKK
jgi:hypothetical protein